jgi:AcrR family transcriptional regulator
MPRTALSSEAIEAFREELCEAATRRFAEAGYAGVTLRGLAKELGVSPMTPYRYFRDKDEIFAAVRAAGFARFAAGQREAFASSDDPAERLRALGRAYADFARREPHAYRIMFEMNRPEDAGHPELRREQQCGWEPIHDASAAAIDAGLLSGEPDAVAHLFWAGLHGVVSLHLAGTLHHLETLDTLVEPMLETLFRGARRDAPQEDAA